MGERCDGAAGRRDDLGGGADNRGDGPVDRSDGRVSERNDSPPRRRFELQSEPIVGNIDSTGRTGGVDRTGGSGRGTTRRTGAVVTFDGVVRDLNEGKTVVSLEYEAYGPLAESTGNEILEDAVTRFGLIDASCVHRTGHLEVGETAVHVVAEAMHRESAFQACRHIIDEVKKRVPIWKKEYYADGETDWIRCAQQERNRSGQPDATLPDG